MFIGAGLVGASNAFIIFLIHGGDLRAAFCVKSRMCRKVKLWTGWLMFHWMVSITVAFNVDVESGVVYQGRQDSLFGFSVAAHRDQDTGW